MLLIGATTYLQLYATEESDAVYLRISLYLIALLLGLGGLRWLTEFLKLHEKYLSIAKKLQRHSFCLFIYAFLFFSMEIIIDDITSSSHLRNIILYSGSMAFLIFYELWLNVLSKLCLTKNAFYTTIIRAYQIVLCLLVLSCSSLGYYSVAAYIIGAIFSSTICIYVFTLFWQLTNSLYDTFNDPDRPTGKKVRELLSIENDKSFIELLFLKVIIQLLLFGLLYVSITSTWSVNTHFFDLIEDTLFYNIPNGNQNAGFNF